MAFDVVSWPARIISNVMATSSFSDRRCLLLGGHEAG